MNYRRASFPALIAAVFFAAAFSVSCARSAEAAADFGGGAAKMAFAEAGAPMPAAPVMEQSRSLPDRNDGQVPAEAARPRGERKLVHRAYLSIEAEDILKAEAAVRAAAERVGGYVSAARRDGNSASFTLRVPRRAFDSTLSGLEGLGRILSRESSAEDVTLHYYDLEGRLATKRGLADTFRSYLGKAKNIEEILAVEARLAELQNEIDALGGQFAHLADLVDYATIDVYLSMPGGALPDSGPTLGDRLGRIFRSFGSFLGAMAAGIVAVIVFGIPALAVAAAAYWLLLGRVGLLLRLFRLVSGKRSKKAAPQ